MDPRDKIAAAVIATISSLFPVLNLAGVLHLTADGIAIVMLCVTNLVTTAGLLFQKQWDKTPSA